MIYIVLAVVFIPMGLLLSRYELVKTKRDRLRERGHRCVRAARTDRYWYN